MRARKKPSQSWIERSKYEIENEDRLLTEKVRAVKGNSEKENKGGTGMNRKKTIYGYQVRNKSNDGIRFYSSSLTDCVKYCPFGCAIWSTANRTYGIKLRLFWMSPFRRIWYDKYSNVINIFHLHVGWELMKGEVPVEIVYEPKDEPASGK